MGEGYRPFAGAAAAPLADWVSASGAFTARAVLAAALRAAFTAALAAGFVAFGVAVGTSSAFAAAGIGDDLACRGLGVVPGA